MENLKISYNHLQNFKIIYMFSYFILKLQRPENYFIINKNYKENCNQLCHILIDPVFFKKNNSMEGFNFYNILHLEVCYQNE